jgi:hypothetical protein
VAPDLQNRWHRFWVMCILRCAGASPEIPDFPETLEKSPEYPGLTDKIVLSGDFQDSPIHPPLGDIKILSIGIRAWCSDLSLTAWSLKMSTTCEVSFEPLRFDGSNYSSWSAHVLHVLHTWGPLLSELWLLASFPRILIVKTRPTYQRRKRKVCSITYSIINLMYNNVSKVIQ